MITHRFIHETLIASAPFIVAFIAAAAAWTAAGLGSSASRRVSPASRHLILSTALFAGPATALMVLTPAAAIIRSLMLAPAAAASIQVGTPVPLALHASAPSHQSELGCVLLAVWAAGVASFALIRSKQWARWNRIARQAAATHDGELLEAFARASGGTSARLAVSAEAAEPMVVGLFRPVVLLPQRYAQSLHEDEIATVFAHELEHVRRHDNTTAAIHEAVATIFWFDPLHWIARRRLLELRERACDQRVLDLGNPARAYAAALAKTCHAAIETPAVACMSGFHVRERIDSIMNYPSNRSRFLRDRFVRATTLLAMGVLVVSSALIVPSPSFAADSKTDSKEACGFEVSLRPGPDNRVLIEANVTSRDGQKVMSAKATTSYGLPVTMSTDAAGRTYKVTVKPDSLGAVATLEVSEGGTLVYRISRDVAMPQNAAAPQALADAHHLTPDMKAPELLTRVEPLYPPEAREARISGIVIVEALIDETGVVRSTKVLKPQPNGLSEAAEAAVKQWVFAPAMLDGKAVPVIFNVTINFKLK